MGLNKIWLICFFLLKNFVIFSTSCPQKGDIYWVNFEPAFASEIMKTRPAIVVSNNFSNVTSTRVMVIPLSSEISKLGPYDFLVNIDNKKGKAILDQMRCIDKKRLKNKIAKSDKSLLTLIDKSITAYLSITL